MTLALEVGIACVVIAAPTLLYLGVLQGLRKFRDGALLWTLAESDITPERLSDRATRMLEKRPVHADGSGKTNMSRRAPRPETVTCCTCGTSNMLGARYCGECLDVLDL